MGWTRHCYTEHTMYIPQISMFSLNIQIFWSKCKRDVIVVFLSAELTHHTPWPLRPGKHPCMMQVPHTAQPVCPQTGTHQRQKFLKNWNDGTKNLHCNYTNIRHPPVSSVIVFSEDLKSLDLTYREVSSNDVCAGTHEVKSWPIQGRVVEVSHGPAGRGTTGDYRYTLSQLTSDTWKTPGVEL